MTGFVIKTTGPDYTVRSTEGDFVCKIKGNFRIKGIKSTNPITVGDVVDFDPSQGYITALHDRRNQFKQTTTYHSSECRPLPTCSNDKKSGNGNHLYRPLFSHLRSLSCANNNSL